MHQPSPGTHARDWLEKIKTHFSPYTLEKISKASLLLEPKLLSLIASHIIEAFDVNKAIFEGKIQEVFCTACLILASTSLA